MKVKWIVLSLLVLSLGVGSAFAAVDVTTGQTAGSFPNVPLPQGQRQYNVLWDLTHGVYGGYEPASGFSTLVAFLAANGFTVTTTTAGIDNIDLSPYDILVVCSADAYLTAYGASEVAAAVNFVDAGGGLLVLGDNPGVWPQNYNMIPQAFGTTCGTGDDESPSVFINHQIFSGINALTFVASGILGVSSPSVIAAWNAAGLPLISLVDPCRVVVLGDINVWDNNYIMLDDNEPFALNVFNCLATGGPTPVDAGTWGSLKSMFR